MYVYEKINCMISFQYILLYILVMLISPIVYIRMRFVQSPASTQIRGKKSIRRKKKVRTEYSLIAVVSKLA